MRALNHGNLEAALRRCRDLFKYHRNADTGKLLFLTCQKLCHMLANDIPMATPVGLNLPSEIHALACQAATICSPGDRVYNIVLCSVSHFTRISHMCCLFTIGHCHKDKRSFSPFYKEPVIIDSPWGILFQNIYRYQQCHFQLLIIITLMGL